MQIMHNPHICPSQIYEDCPAFLQPCLYKADYRRLKCFLDYVWIQTAEVNLRWAKFQLPEIVFN